MHAVTYIFIIIYFILRHLISSNNTTTHTVTTPKHHVRPHWLLKKQAHHFPFSNTYCWWWWVERTRFSPSEKVKPEPRDDRASFRIHAEFCQFADLLKPNLLGHSHNVESKPHPELESNIGSDPSTIQYIACSYYR